MKKNFISYIFIIFLLTSFSIFAEREIDFEKLEIDEKTQIAYVIGEKEAFTGIAKEYYEDKTLKSEYSYKNGKLDRRGKEYYPNGKFKSDAFFIDGLLQGKSIGYYENGNLEYEDNYKDGKLYGLIKTYYENGKIKTEIYYENGEFNGLAKEYYENGQVHIQESYKNGELDGESLNFYENGNLKGREVYDNGVLIEEGIKNVRAEDILDDTTNNKNTKLPYYTRISIFWGIVVLIIFAGIFKIYKAFPKTSHLSEEQKSRIFKILMKHDGNRKNLFSAHRVNGIGTGYYKVRSMMVDNEKIYIFAKMFSFIYIPTPIVFGYLVCYDKDRILASYSNTEFKEAKKEIEETVLYL